jgi:hypothetical protein
MGKKHQNAAAARARAARWGKNQPQSYNSEDEQVIPLSNPPTPSAEPFHQCTGSELLNSVTKYNFLDVEPDSCSECEYMGGVDVDDSDTDREDGQLEWETESTADTLSEFSGDELEENLRMLKGQSTVEAEVPMQPTGAFNEIMVGVSSTVWKKAERNRQLGYNGLSQRTQQRRAQQARAAANERENAKKSCMSVHDLAPRWQLTVAAETTHRSK